MKPRLERARGVHCLALASLLLAGGLASGCSGKDARVQATAVPGHVAAGGRTGGEVIASTAKQESVQPGPAGTPGIPLGSGGNVGGTALGGTVEAARGTAAPGTVASTPAATASAAAAEREKEQLAAAMEATAAHWRAQAGRNGWPVHAPVPVDAAPAIAADARSATGAPARPDVAAPPPDSEKLGTAPRSDDVKTGRQLAPPGVRARAPDKAGNGS